MNIIFIVISVLCIIYGICTGRINELAKGILNVSENTFSLCVTLVTSACFFSGIMNILYDSKFVEKIAKFLNPFLKKIMPTLNDDEAYKYVAMNIAANIFGLGFAATPCGIKAIKRMKELSKEGETATDEMVTFLILNTAGVTLLPLTVISIRQSYHSINPCDFLFVSFFGTLLSCVFGLLIDLYFRKKRKNG